MGVAKLAIPRGYDHFIHNNKQVENLSSLPTILKISLFITEILVLINMIYPLLNYFYLTRSGRENEMIFRSSILTKCSMVKTCIPTPLELMHLHLKIKDRDRHISFRHVFSAKPTYTSHPRHVKYHPHPTANQLAR